MESQADQRVDCVGLLPSHLAQQVLIQLEDHRDFASASCVCRRWRQVVRDEAVWQAGYAGRFPAWGSERALGTAAQQATDAISWQDRYRWRLGLDRNWAKGRRRLVHALDNHHAWVNAVSLLPGGSSCAAAAVASGGSEGAVNVWSLDGRLLHHDSTHSQAVWSLDASAELLVSGGMDGWVNVLDPAAGELVRRLPVGWRGPGGSLPDEADWQQFEVVTSVQLLPGSRLVLAGCMGGGLQLLDVRNNQPAVQSLDWAALDRSWRAAAGPLAGGGQPPQRLFWQQARANARLCAARCHEHLLIVGGDAPAVTLHDLRMGGACFAELALPAGSPRPLLPAVFAMDLLYPRLATGGDRGQVQIWDLSKLDAAPGMLPAVSPAAQPRAPRVVYRLSPGTPGGSQQGASSSSQEARAAAAAAEPPAISAPPAWAGWPSPRAQSPALQQQQEQQRQRQRQPVDGPRSSGVGGCASSAAACSVDCLAGSNERHLQQGLHMGCVYGIKLLHDWRVLTADHAGYVRLWNSGDVVGRAAAAPCLTLCPSFAPSVDDPASALIDPQGGPLRPVGMHCLDACASHLAVAGRDSVVRLYSYE